MDHMPDKPDTALEKREPHQAAANTSARCVGGSLLILFGFLFPPALELYSIIAFALKLLGLGLFLFPVGRGFAQYLASLREQSESKEIQLGKSKTENTEGLINALNRDRIYQQVGSWWVFNLALIVLAIGVAQFGGLTLLAPLSLVAFSTALLTTFWFMRRRAAYLADRVYALRASNAQLGTLGQAQEFFDSRRAIASDVKMVKALDTARKIVDISKAIVGSDPHQDKESTDEQGPHSVPGDADD